MSAKQILDDTVTFDGKTKDAFEPFYKSNKSNEDKYFYFNRISEETFLILKDIKNSKTKTRVAVICDKTFKEKDSKKYDCKFMSFMKQKNDVKLENRINIQLYKINYAFSYLLLKLEKPTYIILSCRYFGNYFKIQSPYKVLNIFYEDFVTCIKGRNETNKNDDIFYTGLLNGKLTEWKIIPILNEKKKKSKNKHSFIVKEIKSIYANKSSITTIELYFKQNILITSGEDKFIYIRKIYDFELLTVINLTYSFGNPIISKTCNIFPSLIKISDLNLLYVLLYDYEHKETIIRGYNLNGLYFAQIGSDFFKGQSTQLFFNNISFTKCSNLIVGLYNSNSIYILSASNLTPIWIKEIQTEEV